jgi:osmotically-inducible protein OsmY
VRWRTEAVARAAQDGEAGFPKLHRNHFREIPMNLFKRCSAVAAAALLLSALGCASTSTGESTGEYVDDAAITTKVKTAMFNEPSLKVLQINVETYKSVVQLSGFADSDANIAKAADVARAVPGVRSVRNDMRLK